MKNDYLSEKEQISLLKEFCESFLNLGNLEEMVEFLTDLLTKNEIMILAKRLKIAKLLMKEWKYRDIKKELKVGEPTIARVAAWLEEAGKGFRMVAERSEKKEIPSDHILEEKKEKRGFKKKYGTYFWPDLLSGKNSKRKKLTKEEKERLFKGLKKLNKKSKIYKEMDKILRGQF